MSAGPIGWVVIFFLRGPIARPARAGLFAQGDFRREDVHQVIEVSGAERRQGIGVGGDQLELAVVEVGSAALRFAAKADFEANDFAVFSEPIDGVYRLPAMRSFWRRVL